MWLDRNPDLHVFDTFKNLQNTVLLKCNIKRLYEKTLSTAGHKHWIHVKHIILYRESSFTSEWIKNNAKGVGVDLPFLLK